MNLIEKPYILPILGVIVGLLIFFHVVSTAAQTPAPDPGQDLLDITRAALPPTIFANTLLPFNPPNTPKGGYLVIDEHILDITGYSSTIDQTDDDPHITASGTNVRWGVVAANFLPVGTKIRVPEHFGNQIFVVEDRMNRRYPYRMDVWFHSRQAAKIFGLTKTRIEIVEKF